MFGAAMAASYHDIPVHTLVYNTLVFLVAASIYHSAFCVWNDICDKDLDGKVGEADIRISLHILNFSLFPR